MKSFGKKKRTEVYTCRLAESGENELGTVVGEAAILQEIETFSNESDQDEEDNEIYSEHDTITDQEISDSEDEEIVRNAWYGKDNTKWAKTPSIRGRTASYNIVTVLPGLIGAARNNRPSTPLEAWNVLPSEEMLQKIVTYTNIKIALCREKYATFKRRPQAKKKCKPAFTADTSLTEVKALLGLLYLQGIFKSGHEDILSMCIWDRETYFSKYH